MADFAHMAVEDVGGSPTLTPYYSATSTVVDNINSAEIAWLEEEMKVYELKCPKSQDLLQQASEVLPAGVASCYHRSPTPFFVQSELSKGSQVIDVDGNSYIDFHSGYGVMALGHQHPQVVLFYSRSPHILN